MLRRIFRPSKATTSHSCKSTVSIQRFKTQKDNSTPIGASASLQRIMKLDPLADLIDESIQLDLHVAQLYRIRQLPAETSAL